MPPGKPIASRLAHRGMRAVAAGDVGRLARLGGAIRKSQTREQMTRPFLEAQELRFALDLHSGFGQSIDQQPLMLVLRIDQGVGERADPGAHRAQYAVRHLLARHPEIHRGHAPSAVDHRIGKTDLAIQLERARLDGERA